MSDDLQALFEASAAPVPRADLADRIAQAATPRAANDNRWGRWAAGLTAIAATVAFAVFALMPANADTEAEAWAQYAETSGFGELYAWVEGEG